MFKEIDKNKAYLLGLLLTDGNLDKDRYSITIELQIRDKQILDDISNIFGGNVIKIHKHDKDGNKILKSYKWSFPISKYGKWGYGKELYRQLEKFYIVPNKTRLEELFIFEDKNIMRHFLRGIWDGDGSFYIRKQKARKNVKARQYLSSSLVSASQKFILQVQEYLQKNGIVGKFETLFHKGYENPVYRVRISTSQSKKLFDFLYKDDGLKLGRKYNVAYEGINIKKSEIFWKEEEIEFLNSNYENMSCNEIAKKLGKTFRAIRSKIFKLKIKKDNNWTEEQIKFLRDNYKDLTLEEIGNRIGRTPKAVLSKALRLKIRKTER